ncbi:hypothetical protein ACJJTC_013748 [Scirpophaga incertulas]
MWSETTIVLKEILKVNLHPDRWLSGEKLVGDDPGIHRSGGPLTWSVGNNLGSTKKFKESPKSFENLSHTYCGSCISWISSNKSIQSKKLLPPLPQPSLKKEEHIGSRGVTFKMVKKM